MACHWIVNSCVDASSSLWRETQLAVGIVSPRIHFSYACNSKGMTRCCHNLHHFYVWLSRQSMHDGRMGKLEALRCVVLAYAQLALDVASTGPHLGAAS